MSAFTKEESEDGIVEQFWREESERFVEATQTTDSFYARRAVLTAELIARHCAPCMVLDVGCGTGLLSYQLALKGFDVYGTDLSEGMLEKAVELTATVLPDAESRFRLTQGETPPFPWKFDIIAGIGVFPYVTDYAGYLGYLSAQLRPRGYIVASSTNNLSLCTARLIAEHIIRFRFQRAWPQVLVNLIRTGVWSGGFVQYNRSTQIHNPADFDHLFSSSRFDQVAAFDLYNVGILGIDDSLERTRLAGWLARRLGWNHIGLYRRIY